MLEIPGWKGENVYMKELSDLKKQKQDESLLYSKIKVGIKKKIKSGRKAIFLYLKELYYAYGRSQVTIAIHCCLQESKIRVNSGLTRRSLVDWLKNLESDFQPIPKTN